MVWDAGAGVHTTGARASTMNGDLPYDPNVVTEYIIKAAQARGIDPNVALKTARSEGLASYVGDDGSSFGPFQLHYGGVATGSNAVPGLGDNFTRDTGLDARNPNTVFSQIDYALNHAAQNGWGAFHGWKGDPMAGLQNARVLPLGQVPSGLASVPSAGGYLTNPDGSQIDLIGPSNPTAFIVHHTGGGTTPQNIQDTLDQRGLSIAYIMDRNGNIWTGAGGGGIQPSNNWPGSPRGLNSSNTIGMEVIAKNDADITPAQVAAARAFIANHYPNTPVYGHGEVNVGHKQATEGATIVSAVRQDRSGPDLLDQYAGATSSAPPSSSSSAPQKGAPDLLDQWAASPTRSAPASPAAPPAPAAPTMPTMTVPSSATQPISLPTAAQSPTAAGPLAATPSDTMATAAAKSAATGALRGVGDIIGTPQTLQHYYDVAEDYVRSYFTGKPVEQVTQERENALAKLHELDAKTAFGRILNAVDPRQVMPTAQSMTERLLPGGGYVPQSLLGRMAQTGIETAVGSLTPGISGPASATRAALATSSGIGAIGEGTTEVTGSPAAGLAASVLFPVGAAGVAGRLGGALMGTVERDTAQLAALARDKYGIPVTAPQMAPASSAARFAGSTINRLPFSGAESTIAAQQGSFNRAVSNTIGENALKLTPEVMKDARTNIGQVFDDVGSRTTINVDPPFENSLLATLTNAGQELSESQMKPLMASFSNIMDKVSTGGTIDGKAYQALVAKNSPLDRAMESQDGYLSHYAGQMKDALDDAFQRSASPSDQAALSDARRQWAALKTIEPLVAKAPTGDISPALLMSRVNQQTHNGLAYGYGGNLGELARIGTRFLKEPSSSGTAERATIIGGLGEMGRALAYGGGALGLGELMKGIPEVSPAEALIGAGAIPAGLAAGRMAGSALRSRWLANALINRSLGAGGPGAASYLARSSLPYLFQQPQAFAPSP